MGYSPEGYKNLLTYKQGQEIYIFTKKFTARFLDPIRDSRLIGHFNDSARSVPRNITEGHKRGNTKSYLDFLGFARASLEELKEDYKELEREYKEGIRVDKDRNNGGAESDKEKNKEEMIRIIEGILTKIYGEDCMLGRQIKSLENRFVEKGDEKEKLNNGRKNYQKQQIINNWHNRF
jgi:four helix bundle suffix protein